MSCDTFRSRFQPGTADAALLAHLRTCDRCLDVAAHADPDVLFRSLGGSELTPPGGLDAFVDGVMQQVRVRNAETTVGATRKVSWGRQLAAAAAVGAAVFGATLIVQTEVPPTMTPRTIARQLAPVSATALTTKPVVETYESQNATIVEMPMETADDVKIVMIFDENLPADL